MKKILFVLAVISSLTSFSQSKVEIIKGGLKNSSQIFSFPKTTSKVLYDRAILFVNKNYKSPEDVLKSKIPSQYIKITAISENCITYKFKADYDDITQDFVDLNYTIEINFKNDKVQINIVDATRKYITYKSKSLIDGSIDVINSNENYLIGNKEYFNADGIVKPEDTWAKESFEKCINDLIDSLVNSLKKSNNF